MLETEQQVLSSDVRLISPPTVNDTTWEIICLRSGRRWTVGQRVVRILLGSDEDHDGLVAAWAEQAGITRSRQQDAERARWYEDARSSGWVAASDLIALYKSYRSADYRDQLEVSQLEARSHDQARELWSARYSHRGADLLRNVDSRLSEAFGPPRHRGTLSTNEVETIVAAAVGLTGEIQRGDVSVPLGIRPSFAALQSVAAFVLVGCVDGLEPGAYEAGEEGLMRLGNSSFISADGDVLWDLVPGNRRASFVVDITIVLTVCWKRLRMRYVDPVAFRSAIIESGHAVAAADLLARSWGLHTYAHGGLDDPALEAALGISEAADSQSAIFALSVGTKSR